uniref:Uncharacterized protein n=1 Tax=Knipowitschia caucasica TaxID=637954 RepID=A0AAV2KWH4_KNICA
MVDSGATKHIITDIGRFEEFDPTFKPQSHILELADGERASGRKSAGDRQLSNGLVSNIMSLIFSSAYVL